MSNRITFAVVIVATLAGGAVLWQMHNPEKFRGRRRLWR